MQQNDSLVKRLVSPLKSCSGGPMTSPAVPGAAPPAAPPRPRPGAPAAGGRVSEGLCTRPPRRQVPHAGAGHRAGISEDGRQEQCTSTEGRRQQGQEQAGRFRGMVLTYTSVDGHTILVGQSAFENEQLCHRAAQQGALQTPTGCT